MHYGNWVPISKGLLKYLPHDRPYSKVEAAYSLQNDIDRNALVSIAGCAKIWGWTRRRVKNFFDEMGVDIAYSLNKKAPGKGGHVVIHLPDMLKAKSGHVRAYDNRHLDKKADMLDEKNGHLPDMLRHTTIETNTNTSLKDLSEPPLETPPGGVISIPLKGSKTFTPTKEQLAQWQESFPGVDVTTELRKIKQWNIDNPRKRKTPTGICRHICYWLGKEQEKAGPVPNCSACDYKQRGYCAKTGPCNEFRPSTL